MGSTAGSMPGRAAERGDRRETRGGSRARSVRRASRKTRWPFASWRQTARATTSRGASSRAGLCRHEAPPVIVDRNGAFAAHRFADQLQRERSDSRAPSDGTGRTRDRPARRRRGRRAPGPGRWSPADWWRAERGRRCRPSPAPRAASAASRHRQVPARPSPATAPSSTRMRRAAKPSSTLIEGVMRTACDIARTISRPEPSPPAWTMRGGCARLRGRAGCGPWHRGRRRRRSARDPRSPAAPRRRMRSTAKASQSPSPAREVSATCSSASSSAPRPRRCRPVPGRSRFPVPSGALLRSTTGRGADRAPSPGRRGRRR